MRDGIPKAYVGTDRSEFKIKQRNGHNTVIDHNFYGYSF